MSDPRETSDADRLKALDERIRKAKAGPEQKPHMEEHYSQAQLAWRMVIELVAGLVIGFGIGYGLDLLLGSTPWLMIIFVFLGFAAGVKTMLRSAQEMQREMSSDEEGEGQPAPAGDDEDEED